MNTLPRLLQHQAKTRPKKNALRVKDLGLWRNQTWAETYANVRRMSCGLAKQGTVSGDKVAVIGNNTPDMYESILACQVLGAIPVLLYANIFGTDMETLLACADVSYVIAEDQQQVDSVLNSYEILPDIKKIIYSVKRGMSHYDQSLTMSIAELKESGGDWDDKEFQQHIDKIKPGSSAVILFNSGLSSERKPVILTHKNLIVAAEHIAEIGQADEDDEYLSFMPISLSTNLVCGHVMSLLKGFCLSCPESPETVLSDLREISPSIIYGPQYVYKHIASLVHDQMERSPGFLYWCYHHFLEKAKQGQKSVFGNLLLMSPMRNVYGFNKVRLAMTGGSTIGDDVIHFFKAIGVNLCSVYGTAETAGCITIQPLNESSTGDVGRPFKGTEVEVTDSGEILCRGDTLFSGYYNDEQGTRATMRDGWFVTGDVGEWLPDGRLVILDTQTGIGKLKDGTEFYPGLIESTVKASPYIREAIVSLNSENDDLVACVTLEPDMVGTWADLHDLRYTGYSELACHKEVCGGLVGDELIVANRHIGHNQPFIKRYFVLHRQFSPIEEEVTWTNKLHRVTLLRRLSGMFDAAFSGKQKALYADARDTKGVELAIYNISDMAPSS